MLVTKYLIQVMISLAARRFEKLTLEPETAQKELLMSIIGRNADTEYGRKYGFDRIKSVAEYQSRVPVIAYEDISGYIERVTRGERNVLTAEDPVMFAQTSGTTGKPKFIPITPSCQGQVQSDLMRAWLYHARKAHPDIFDGQVVSLVSPAVEGYTESGLPYGSASGHIYKSMPRIIRSLYAIPYDVFEIEDYETKYYVIMRLAIARDIRFLATANPSTILKLCEKVNEHADDLIEDIRRGTLNKALPIEPHIGASVRSRLKADPALADRLQAMRANRAGRLLPADYWPRLSLIGCWKGGTVGHYVDNFPGWFDPDGLHPVAVRDWGLLSSEARCSVPVSDEGSLGVLSVGTNFYEFVEADEVTRRPDDRESWRFLTVEKLQFGREYYIFLTTSGGLYRYDINDVIAVGSSYNRTPQIGFLRKGRGMANISGEKLSVNQVIEAVQEAGRKTNIVPAYFKAEADQLNSRYILRIEFMKSYAEPSLREFLRTADSELKAVNVEYKAKRNSLRLNSPVLHVMREGWHDRARKEEVARGKRAFQAKTELLSPMKAMTERIKPELISVVEIDPQPQKAEGEARGF
jgi:hypothetical protein